MLDRCDGPVGQTHQLLGHSLNPSGDQRHLGCVVTDSSFGHISNSHVGLVKHVWVGMKTKQVARIIDSGLGNQVIEIALSARGINPLLGSAFCSITIVVDSSGISGNNDKTIVTVLFNCADQRPESVLLVYQDRSSVVANNKSDLVVQPCLNNIAVVKTCDSRGHQTVGRIAGSLINTHLLHPRAIEVNLATGILVGGIVQLQMCESVRKVGEVVEVVFVQEPRSKVVQLGTRLRPRVVSVNELVRPFVGACTEGLHKFQWRVGRRCIINRCVWVANTTRVRFGNGFDNIAVTVVGKLQPKVGTLRETGVDTVLPVNVSFEIRSSDLELLLARHGVVETSGQLNVINLSIEVDLALANEDTASHPVNMSVLKESSSLGPVMSPTEEPNELLAAIGESVDDTGNGIRGVATARAKFGNLFGDSRVGDGGRVMVDALGREAGISALLISIVHQVKLMPLTSSSWLKGTAKCP
ncbi:hypothetical protein HG530_009156 [Fusarium avenaceum]|nr:hypothetical protein HG530_009156 [Fusarium avenaceum]